MRNLIIFAVLFLVSCNSLNQDFIEKQIEILEIKNNQIDEELTYRYAFHSEFYEKDYYDWKLIVKMVEDFSSIDKESVQNLLDYINENYEHKELLELAEIRLTKWKTIESNDYFNEFKFELLSLQNEIGTFILKESDRQFKMFSNIEPIINSFEKGDSIIYEITLQVYDTVPFGFYNSLDYENPIYDKQGKIRISLSKKDKNIFPVKGIFKYYHHQIRHFEQIEIELEK